MNIYTQLKESTIDNFQVKEGFLVFADGYGNIEGITSGFTHNEFLFVYTYKNGDWVGRWEDIESSRFPVQEVFERQLEEYPGDEELLDALKLVE